ncbi:MAG: hypothetical protein H0U97_16020 [Gammaproteobacteria bacterium]|nr:hypothetical protein [Gammaproteobacteria bacterium]
MPVEELEDSGCDRRRRAVNGRPGIAVIVFAMSTKQLAEQVLKRVGQDHGHQRLACTPHSDPPVP